MKFLILAALITSPLAFAKQDKDKVTCDLIQYKVFTNVLLQPVHYHRIPKELGSESLYYTLHEHPQTMKFSHIAQKLECDLLPLPTVSGAFK